MFLHYNKIIDSEWVASNYPDDAEVIAEGIDEWVSVYLRNANIAAHVEQVLVQTTKIPVLVEFGIADDNLYYVADLPWPSWG